MPPLEREPTTEAEMRERVRAARARLYGVPQPAVVRPAPAAPPLARKEKPLPPVLPGAAAVVLDGDPPPSPRIDFEAPRIPIKSVIKAVCKYYNFTHEELTSERRREPLCRARRVGYYVASKLTPLSYPEIAKAFGRMDHSTVISGIMAFEKRIADNPQCEEAKGAEEITAELRTRYPNAGEPQRLTREERNYDPAMPSKGKPYSLEEIEFLRRSIGEGKSISAIAEALSRPVQTVREKAVKIALIERRKKTRRAKSERILHKPRWTAEQKEQLKQYRRARVPTRLIVVQLGKSANSVRAMSRNLGFGGPPRQKGPK